MVIQIISRAEAAALEAELTKAFNQERTAKNGLSSFGASGLTVAGISIPAGSTVFFPPLNSTFYGPGSHRCVRSQNCAIIYLDEIRGSTIRIDGTFSRVAVRNCR